MPLNFTFAYGGSISAKAFIIAHTICLILFTSLIVWKLIRNKVSLKSFVTIKSSIAIYLFGELCTLLSLLSLNLDTFGFRIGVMGHNMGECLIGLSMLFPQNKVLTDYGRNYLIGWSIFISMGNILPTPIGGAIIAFATIFGDVITFLAGLTIFFRSNNGNVKFLATNIKRLSRF